MTASVSIKTEHCNVGDQKIT